MPSYRIFGFLFMSDDVKLIQRIFQLVLSRMGIHDEPRSHLQTFLTTLKRSPQLTKIILNRRGV